MGTLIVVIEKSGLLGKKKEIFAHIYLNSATGMVIDAPDQKLKAEIRDRIKLSDDQIKTLIIPEKTYLLNQIKNNLRGQKLNGAAVVDLIPLVNFG